MWRARARARTHTHTHLALLLPSPGSRSSSSAASRPAPSTAVINAQRRCPRSRGTFRQRSRPMQPQQPPISPPLYYGSAALSLPVPLSLSLSCLCLGLPRLSLQEVSLLPHVAHKQIFQQHGTAHRHTRTHVHTHADRSGESFPSSSPVCVWCGALLRSGPQQLQWRIHHPSPISRALVHSHPPIARQLTTNHTATAVDGTQTSDLN